VCIDCDTDPLQTNELYGGSLHLLASKANGPLNGNRNVGHRRAGDDDGQRGDRGRMFFVGVTRQSTVHASSSRLTNICNDPQAPIYHLRVQPALIIRTARMMQARAQSTANVLKNHPASNQTATSLSMPNISLARCAID
jgi:hypothetical protein